MRENVLIAVGVLIAAVSVVLLTVGGIIEVESISCRNTATAMKVPWRYSLSTDCLIRIDGEWLPLKTYRGQEPVSR